MSQNEPATPIKRVRPAPVRPLDLDVAEGSILVKRVSYGTEHEHEEKVRVPVFATHPGRVRVTGSVTRNLGDYNSCRVEVMVELPCYPVESEVDVAYRHASALVDRYIEQELAVATGQPGVPT